MGHSDGGAAIESGVDGTETQDLGFGPAGSGSKEARTRLAQVRVTVFPKLFCVLVAAHDDVGGGRGGPIEGLAQFAGDGEQLAGCEGAPVG